MQHRTTCPDPIVGWRLPLPAAPSNRTTPQTVPLFAFFNDSPYTLF